MEVILRLASAANDALVLILGEAIPTPAKHIMRQYPYLVIY